MVSLCFHLFSICIWLLEKKWIFLEVWDENKQNNHQDRTILLNHNFALPGGFSARNEHITPGRWQWEAFPLSFISWKHTPVCIVGVSFFKKERNHLNRELAWEYMGFVQPQPQPWGGCVSLSIHSWFLQILTQMQILLVRNWRSKKSASFCLVWISDLFLFKSTVTCHPSMKPAVAFL